MVTLADCVITRAGRELWRTTQTYPLVLAARVVTAQAALPAGFHAATAYSDARVPKPRDIAPAQRELIVLYERALETLRQSFGSDVVPRFAAIHQVLHERYPDEWLLRWNLLESLIKLDKGAELAAVLEAELERMEIRFAGTEPIATGLAYLRGLGLNGSAGGAGRGGRT